MDDDAQGARGTRGARWEGGLPDGRRHPAPPPGLPHVPPPAGPPAPPPMPAAPPRAAATTVQWLNAPRPAVAPGVWRYGHRPKAAEQPRRPSLLAPAIALALWLVVWVLLVDMRVPYVRYPLVMFTPGEWWTFDRLRPGVPSLAWSIQTLYNQALVLLAGLWAARVGNWAGVYHFYAKGDPARARLLVSVSGAVIALWLVLTDRVPLDVVIALFPQSWLQGGGNRYVAGLFGNLLSLLIAAAVVWPFARLGRWPDAVRRRRRGGSPREDRPRPEPEQPGTAAAYWPELRAAGLTDAAEALTAAVHGGRLNDVDCVRVRHAWDTARNAPDRLASFTETVLRRGSDAFLHPSGSRDLPLRTVAHDPLTGQVRIGDCADDPRNPRPLRGAGAALEPALLGTSLLVVGPPGSGKTTRVIRPVVESLSLAALTGRAAVVAVGGSGGRLGPDEAYDVVVKIGDPASAHDLDLYGGTTDPDEAAAVLAQGLVGDTPSVDSRRAATVLGQLLGPFRAAHGRFPGVPELRELLEGSAAALTALRQALEAAGQGPMLRELDVRVRQAGSAGDPAAALADRIAVLDRPAFAGFFATGHDARPFSLRALEKYPLRVRVDLPERGHADASRMLARLVLAQFTAVAEARADRARFLCLVLDDATQAVSAEAVRGIRLLRSAHAGVVLALRTLDDVPEELHTALLGAVGCKAALSGVTTWDGKRFAEAWGKEWVEVREVAEHGVFADQPLTRALHGLRKMATGKAVTTEAVTVRQVERERWSASALAYELPPGHAVVSVTTAAGEHAPPMLVALRG
ncbi:ATP/GTP-binding protein [uncultured Streptomyces sp.]|uniref:ATP/GTP-binding protein n=1 Tax=uncultured Streptomyces sp. TaxID=174707 RepID=UPI0026026D67|nr:ATP/GTP-binding protein [uncultured Streptomyces sp.]